MKREETGFSVWLVSYASFVQSISAHIEHEFESLCWEWIEPEELIKQRTPYRNGMQIDMQFFLLVMFETELNRFLHNHEQMHSLLFFIASIQSSLNRLDYLSDIFLGSGYRVDLNKPVLIGIHETSLCYSFAINQANPFYKYPLTMKTIGFRVEDFISIPSLACILPEAKYFLNKCQRKPVDELAMYTKFFLLCDEGFRYDLGVIWSPDLVVFTLFVPLS